MFQLGEYRAIPLDAVGAEHDVHGDDSREQQTLEPCWQDTCFHGSDAHLLLMTMAKNRCIQEMFFDPAEFRIWHLEVSLTVVVQARQSSNILHRTDGDLVEDHADDDCSKCNENVI